MIEWNIFVIIHFPWLIIICFFDYSLTSQSSCSSLICTIGAINFLQRTSETKLKVFFFYFLILFFSDFLNRSRLQVQILSEKIAVSCVTLHMLQAQKMLQFSIFLRSAASKIKAAEDFSSSLSAEQQHKVDDDDVGVQELIARSQRSPSHKYTMSSKQQSQEIGSQTLEQGGPSRPI